MPTKYLLLSFLLLLLSALLILIAFIEDFSKQAHTWAHRRDYISTERENSQKKRKGTLQKSARKLEKSGSFV